LLFSANAISGSSTEFINNFRLIIDQLRLFNMRMPDYHLFGTSFVKEFT